MSTHTDSHSHSASEKQQALWHSPYFFAVLSFLMLIIGIAMDEIGAVFFQNPVRIIWYSIAYIPVGFPVLKQAWQQIIKGDVFTEFLLMTIATIGAFALGHYHEGVAVMLFYTIGELVQHAAVDKSRNNIKALLDVRPKIANVWRNEALLSVHPEEVSIGEKVLVRNGEKIPLDGILLSQEATLNTAALTGESKPDTKKSGDVVLAGSINLSGVIEIRTTKVFKDTSVARILHLVQEASSRKAPTELFIRKFARVYTPIVVLFAVGLIFLPYFFVADYHFNDWFYRALIFLVISCPCALVISIPLGYFGGLGAASRHGILFKGASYLDTITKVNTIAFDKTGTLTEGVFQIEEIQTFSTPENQVLNYATALEAQSTHPIARAILEHHPVSPFTAEEVVEIEGHGISGIIEGKRILAGNLKLMKSNAVILPPELKLSAKTTVLIAADRQLVGAIVISDRIKEDTEDTIKKLKSLGFKKLIMLSGDQSSIAEEVGNQLGLDAVFGDLLPEDKLRKVEELKATKDAVVAFVGDGINDAPVLAASDVGIAMGAMGSDVAIETADVVIQTDQPSKIVQALKIGRSTKKIVWQNIALAFGVKFIVLLLGAGGIATMWEAVFADVGVAFLAILNAVRLQKMNWR